MARHRALVATALAVVVAAGAVWWRLAPDDDGDDFDRAGREGSVEVAASAPLPPAEAPARYDLTYRVEESATDEGVVTTERVQVERPFSSHVEVRAGRPPGGEVRSRRTSGFATLGLVSQLEQRLLAVPPALATGDLRADLVVAAAVEAGLAERRERRRVAGRPCQVYRFGAPVLGGELRRYEAGGAEWADACVDAAGLVLEEVWVKDGRRLRRKVAERVVTAPRFDDDLFVLEGVPELSVEAGGGSVRKADADFTYPTGLWVLEGEPLPGFALRGDYGVVLPRLDIQGVTPDEAGERPRSFVTVWEKGRDFVAVDRGDGVPFEASPHGRPVDLGELGRGEAVLELRSNEVRVEVDRGYVRVYGTVPLDDLVEVARRLRRAP